MKEIEEWELYLDYKIFVCETESRSSPVYELEICDVKKLDSENDSLKFYCKTERIYKYDNKRKRYLIYNTLNGLNDLLRYDDIIQFGQFKVRSFNRKRIFGVVSHISHHPKKSGGLGDCTLTIFESDLPSLCRLIRSYKNIEVEESSVKFNNLETIRNYFIGKTIIIIKSNLLFLLTTTKILFNLLIFYIRNRNNLPKVNSFERSIKLIKLLSSFEKNSHEKSSINDNMDDETKLDLIDPRIGNNPNQESALKNFLNFLNSCYEDDLFYIIHGPPGTGKTQLAKEIILQMLNFNLKNNNVQNNGEYTIAVSSHINRAVDNIFLKLININSTSKEGRFKHGRILRNYQGRIVRLGSKIIRSKIFNEGLNNKEFKDYYAENLKFPDILTKKIAVFGGTISRFTTLLYRELKRYEILFDENLKIEPSMGLKYFLEIFNLIDKFSYFSLVLIDECSIIDFHMLFIMLFFGGKFLLCGDYHQLSSIKNLNYIEKFIFSRSTFIAANELMELKNELKNKLLKRMRISVFEALVERLKNRNGLYNFLNCQYRGNKLIFDYASNFYEKYNNQKLLTSKEVRNIKLSDIHNELDDNDPILNDNPLVWIDTKEFLSEPRIRSWINKKEAELIAEICIKLYNLEKNQKIILEKRDNKFFQVLVTYKPQEERIRDILKSKYYDKINVYDNRISTIDSFQGRQAEIIIVDLTFNSNNKINYKWSMCLQNYRRLLVAITRARRKLIIVGSSDLINITEKMIKEYFEEKENRKLALQLLNNNADS
ncbi:MAG: DEAD/DEAH box helicase, partial [Candidatus Helarchaeota archaeon]